MPVPAKRPISLSQRIAILLLGLVLGLWLRGCTNGSIYTSAGFTTFHRYSGITLWATGHYKGNSFTVTGFTERWGFYHILGFEAGHPVDLMIAPHWLFLALAVPPGLWLTLATLRETQRRRRGVRGLCVSCGYSLAGNTSDVCPECGTKLKSAPFTFQAAGMEVTEGVIDINGEERYALTISTSVTSAHPVESQIRRVNEAMRSWLRQRGSECGRLIISFDTDRSQEHQLVSWTIRLVNQNIPEGAVLKKLQIELLLRDVSGKPFNRMTLGEPFAA